MHTSTRLRCSAPSQPSPHHAALQGSPQSAFHSPNGEFDTDQRNRSSDESGFDPTHEGLLCGLSHKAILHELDQSLIRLKTDYVDLYQIHRWDYETPIEETLEALHDVVKAGKVRYIGASSMYAWQFAKSLYLADLHGWTRFVSMQNHYNLLYREEEREMIPLCQSEGIGIIPWSPLARGRLARPWQSEHTKRYETDQFGKSMYSQTEDADHKVVDRLGQVAEQRGVARAQLALAWLLSKRVTSPIVGAPKPTHLQDAVAALSLRLTPEEVASLEEPYAPHPVLGFS